MEDQSKPRILVVEDEKFMRQVICDMLESLGYKRPVGAEDGEAGLEALTEPGSPFGLVICDIKMPKVTGIDFVWRVRTNLPRPYKEVPILILTGYAEKKSMEEFVELGIHGFLVKPVSRETLKKQVERALTSPPIDPAAIRKSK